MKAADKSAMMLSIGCLLMLTTVFAKPLHIPEPWEFLPISLAFVCYFFVFRLNKQAKLERLASNEAPRRLPMAARRRKFWIVVGALIAGSASCLPLMPYTVENFYPGLYFYVVPAQVVFLAIFLAYFWRKMIGSGDSPKDASRRES